MTHKATWNGAILAESDKCENVGGLWYFPPKSVKIKEYFSKSEETSVCITKGTANFYNIKVDGKTLSDAAWYYPDPKPAAKNIKDYIAFAFWKGVKVE